jgi:hypothetical protein
MDYSELKKKSEKDYLNPKNFKTSYDKEDEHANEKYKYGLKIGSEYGHICINSSSVWLAGDSASSGILSSSEGIGYHKNTRKLLEGFIDSGAEITVIREDKNGKNISHVIQNGDRDLLENTQKTIINKLQEENPLHKIIGLEPLIGVPLMSQVQHENNYSQLGLCDLKFNKETSSYQSIKDHQNVIFVLSNLDISQDKIIKDVQFSTSNKIDDCANVFILGVNNDNGFVKTNPETLKVDNKIITIYPQGKDHYQDTQKVYCEIRRTNELKKSKKKNTLTP